jgi:hypothetical protein
LQFNLLLQKRFEILGVLGAQVLLEILLRHPDNIGHCPRLLLQVVDAARVDTRKPLEEFSREELFKVISIILQDRLFISYCSYLSDLLEIWIFDGDAS